MPRKVVPFVQGMERNSGRFLDMSRKFSNDNYIHVPGFAIARLKLAGNELLCFSLIYGMSQDGESEFYGSLAYVASALNVTKQNAKAIISRLVDKGLVIKIDVVENRVKYCHYKVNLRGIAETATGVIETATPPVIESVTVYNDNKEIDNKEDNKENIASGELFAPETIQQTEKVKRPRKTSEKLCLFENSRYYDYDEFIKEFQQPEFRAIDIVHYYHVVADWSASKGAKRRDWISQTRNIIRSDIEKGKLHKITASSDTLSPEALQYLKDMAD